MNDVWLALVLVLALGALYVERQIHPWRRCPRCKGTGRMNRMSSPSETWAVCRKS